MAVAGHGARVVLGRRQAAVYGGRRHEVVVHATVVVVAVVVVVMVTLVVVGRRRGGRGVLPAPVRKGLQVGAGRSGRRRDVVEPVEPGTVAPPAATPAAP